MASVASVILGSGAQDAMASVIGGAYARRDEREVKTAFAFLLKIALLASLAALIIIFFLPAIAGRFYGDSRIGFYAAAVMLAAIFSSSFFSLTSVALQMAGRIKEMTVLIFSDQVLRFGAALILVVAGLGVSGAVGGQLAGAAVIFSVSVFIWRRIAGQIHSLPSLSELAVQFFRVPLKRYFGFSFWVAADRNMGNLFMALPVVLAGIYLAASEVTFFKLAFGFVNLALSLLGPISVLLNLEFPKMKVENATGLRTKFIKISLYSLGLSSLLTLGAIIIAPLAFKILYGVSFMPSVKYVAGLLIYGCLFGIGVGLGPMWRALNRVKISIFINVLVLGAGIPFGLWLIRLYGPWGAVMMVTIWFTVSHLASFSYLLKKLRT